MPRSRYWPRFRYGQRTRCRAAPCPLRAVPLRVPAVLLGARTIKIRPAAPLHARALLLLALLLLVGGAALASPAAATRETEHFTFYYNPDKMTAAQVDQAVREGEAAFKYVSAQFPDVHEPERIDLRLDAHFHGATGYAAPGGISGKGKRDAIGLRFEDLPVLGLTPDFLFRHELTHLFAGRWEDGRPDRDLAAATLGEGLADLVADGRNRLGLPLSFAAELQAHGSWIDPLELFLHPPDGAPPRPRNGRLSYESVYQWRIERYVEPSLFLAYVRSRIGWGKMRSFYIDYTKAAASREPASGIRAVFRQDLGDLPEDFMEGWQAAIRSAPKDPPADRLRWFSERVYSAVQWYDFLVLGKVIAAADQSPIEAEFKTLNVKVASRQLDAAEALLKEVLAQIARASGGHGTVSPVRWGGGAASRESRPE